MTTLKAYTNHQFPNLASFFPWCPCNICLFQIEMHHFLYLVSPCDYPKNTHKQSNYSFPPHAPFKGPLTLICQGRSIWTTPLLIFQARSTSFKIWHAWVVATMSLSRAHPSNESLLSLVACYKNFVNYTT